MLFLTYLRTIEQRLMLRRFVGNHAGRRVLCPDPLLLWQIVLRTQARDNTLPQR